MDSGNGKVVDTNGKSTVVVCFNCRQRLELRISYGRASPETAYHFMSLADELRPDAPFISERIRHYREKLGQK